MTEYTDQERQDAHELVAVIETFGEAVCCTLEQMLHGQWRDEDGKMVVGLPITAQLTDALNRATALRSKLMMRKGINDEQQAG